MNDLISLKERIIAALPDLAGYDWESRLSFDETIPSHIVIYLPQEENRHD